MCVYIETYSFVFFLTDKETSLKMSKVRDLLISLQYKEKLLCVFKLFILKTYMTNF